MENVAPCWGECRVDHDYQYLLRLAPVVVIRRVMSGDVGAGVPETSYLGAGRGGGCTWIWGYNHGARQMGLKFLHIGMVAVLFLIYLISGRGVYTRHDFFVPLASSFWQGKTYVSEMRYELHEMVTELEVKTGVVQEPLDGEVGKFYVIYPPMPAVVLMPFVAIWGQQTNQSVVSALIAALGVLVAYRVFKQLNLKTDQLWWLTLLYGFGSMLWYHAVVGSAWYFAHVCALLFLWLAILAVLKKKSWWLVGMWLGLAYLSRFAVILTLPFFIYLRRVEWKSSWKLLTTLGIFVCASLVYNWVRYGTIGNYGYWLLEHRWYNLANEYINGSYDWSYAPRHLYALFASMPSMRATFPYLVPNMTSMALWVVFPALAIVPLASLKNKLVQASWLASISVVPAHFFHGGVGASQFGYRYALDYLPFLLIIIAVAVKEKFVWWQKGLIIFSIMVNAWGIYANFWQ